MKFIIFLVLFPLSLLGQRTPAPALLVYGSEVEAFTAALQSAKSGVPTVWIIPDGKIAPSLTTVNTSITSNQNLDSGIWLELLMSIANSKEMDDSLSNRIKKDLSARVVLNNIDKMSSQEQNLTVIKNKEITKIDLGKRGWQAQLSDRQKYNIRTIIDATPDAALSQRIPSYASEHKSEQLSKTEELSKEQCRTLLGVAEFGENIYGIRLNNIAEGEYQNLFTLKGLKQIASDDTNTIPIRMQFGQALGATAAYTAFFRTTVDKIDIRKLQTELLTFNMRIAPWTDIQLRKKNALRHQKLFLSGIFDNKDNLFHKDQPVGFEEVSPVLNRFFSRSQLWFLNNKGSNMTIKDVLSLVKFIGMKGDEVDRQVEKDWKNKLHFAGDFDIEKEATREQFSVIMDIYASPYNTAVSREGNIIR